MGIIQRLEEKITLTGIKIPAITAATGIPTERMRKWLKGIGNPKAEDTKKLEAFLRGDKRLDKVPRGTDVSESDMAQNSKGPQRRAEDQELIDSLNARIAEFKSLGEARDLVINLRDVLKAFEGIESTLGGLVATNVLKAEDRQKISGKLRKARKSGKI